LRDARYLPSKTQSAQPPALLRPTPVALLALTLLWALFFWRLLTPNTADRVIFPDGDFTGHYFAFADYQADRLRAGELPLWNPYNHGGDTFAGNIQFAAWYPPRWLAIALAGPDYTIEDYQIEVAAHYGLISVMMYAFLRALIGRSLPALAGAVFYTYSGYLTGYPMLQVSVLESVAWTPLVFLGLHLSVERRGWWAGGVALAGAGLGLSFLGGHPQTTLQIIYFGLGYLLFGVYQKRIGRLGFVVRALVWIGAGGGLAAVALLPAQEFTALSARVGTLAYADKANGFTPRELAQAIWPSVTSVWSPLYLGAAGFLLGVGALLRPRAEHTYWIAAGGIALLLALGGNSIIYDAFYTAVPGFNLFRQQERAASVTIFALSVLAAYQVHWLTVARSALAAERTRFAVLSYAHLALTGLAFAAAVVGEFLGAPITPRAANAISFAFIASLLFTGWRLWSQADPRLIASAALLALIVFDLFTVNTRSSNFVPDTPENRVRLPPALEVTRVSVPGDIRWRVDGAAGLLGYGTYWRIPDIYGTGPFVLAATDDLRAIPVDRLWEVFAVRYVTAIDEPPDPQAVELLAYDVNNAGQEFRLFEIVDPRPIAHLVYDVRDAQGSREFARQIMADPHVDLREMAILTQPQPLDLPTERPENAAVTDFRMVTPERVEVAVSTPDNALLTVAIPHHPGWRADINGERAPIYDNYAGLMAIPVAPGADQAVTLTFRPPSVILGAAISLLALISMAALVIGDAVWLNRLGRQKRLEELSRSAEIT
jgi:hypothetical protein